MRNIERASLRLGRGLNVFEGRNAQGKTSLLEAVALLSRGRSFRADDACLAIRRGAASLRVEGVANEAESSAHLRLDLAKGSRLFHVDGRPTKVTEYSDKLEAVVYSTERLRAIQSSMRERRAYVDRAGSRLWPAFRQAVRDFERTLEQRNAALKRDGRDLPTWNAQLAQTGGRLRQRRALYVDLLARALAESDVLSSERIEIRVPNCPSPGDEGAYVALLSAEIDAQCAIERRVGRSLVGPQRDTVFIGVDGHDVVQVSSGQARTALLALVLATLSIYERERGRAAIALLDDLDSELDEERTAAVCRLVARRCQTLVTTAHRGWAQRLDTEALRFHVEGGEVSEA